MTSAAILRRVRQKRATFAAAEKIDWAVSFPSQTYPAYGRSGNTQQAGLSETCSAMDCVESRIRRPELPLLATLAVSHLADWRAWIWNDKCADDYLSCPCCRGVHTAVTKQYLTHLVFQQQKRILDMPTSLLQGLACIDATYNVAMHYYRYETDIPYDTSLLTSPLLGESVAECSEAIITEMKELLADAVLHNVIVKRFLTNFEWDNELTEVPILNPNVVRGILQHQRLRGPLNAFQENNVDHSVASSGCHCRANSKVSS